MRILIVDQYYPAFLRAHYAGRPGLAAEPYAAQWRALMDEFFGSADSYSHFLARLGHTAEEVVINCRPLQRAWAREHGVRPPGRLRARLQASSSTRFLELQLEDFAPDVVYLQDLSVLTPADMRRVKRRNRYVVGQLGTEPPPTEWLKAYDLVVTSFPHLLTIGRRHGVRIELLRLGFDDRVLSRLPADGVRSGAVFVGAVGRSPRWTRNEVLAAAAHRAPIEFWGYGARDWPADAPLRRRYKGEAWGMEMYHVFRRAKIVLNRHGDVAGQHANNLRLYEATGVGALLLTDAQADLGELFDVGTEVVTYDDADDLAEKVSYYLEHDRERDAIAAAGQRRTLADHTYARRMEELSTLLATHLP
jgi:spore maturation protein CgeB